MTCMFNHMLNAAFLLLWIAVRFKLSEDWDCFKTAVLAYPGQIPCKNWVFGHELNGRNWISCGKLGSVHLLYTANKVWISVCSATKYFIYYSPAYFVKERLNESTFSIFYECKAMVRSVFPSLDY